MQHGANAGLPLAMALLKPIKAKFPEVGWADLMQLASATAVEVAGKTLGYFIEPLHVRRGNVLIKEFCGEFRGTRLSGKSTKYVLGG